MRALLDVNVLIALLDGGHASHSAAFAWFTAHAATGWASCPITQNGCVRIMSHPAYPGAFAIRDIVQRLHRACLDPVHEFWTDDISVLDSARIDATRVHSPKQLTDIYLLALAVHRDGVFVTFDRSVAIGAVPGATKRSLIVL